MDSGKVLVGGRVRGKVGEPVGGCMLAVVVGCYVGLGWNVGDACKSWSHICSSWYLPRFLLRGGS